ncbi:hypothetical protein AMELA_G00255090 [Ameiurus melas]|uniref:Uncharacterized protein n=1 Tax=Ameiurus melas TaxID=219545 RepID=A0A7J5ZR94_AMEME|nr:hypothetical protein AMELA_G00255090 [Ameiurus melas]
MTDTSPEEGLQKPRLLAPRPALISAQSDDGEKRLAVSLLQVLNNVTTVNLQVEVSQAVRQQDAVSLVTFPTISIGK